METEVVGCECCGFKEECTQDYIAQEKAKFDGKWLCGLCSVAARDELTRGQMAKSFAMEDAVKAHMSFCRESKSNPTEKAADGMRQLLRKRSRRFSSSSSSSSK